MSKTVKRPAQTRTITTGKASTTPALLVPRERITIQSPPTRTTVAVKPPRGRAYPVA